MKKHLNRRTFIRNTSLGAMASPLFLKPGKAAGEPEKPAMAYKTPGRTGFEVTDIAAGYPSGESVLRV